MGLALLREEAVKAYLSEFWRSARERQGVQRRRCPACGNWMTEVAPPTDGDALQLDVCTVDQFVWFDPQEQQG